MKPIITSYEYFDSQSKQLNSFIVSCKQQDCQHDGPVLWVDNTDILLEITAQAATQLDDQQVLKKFNKHVHGINKDQCVLKNIGGKYVARPGKFRSTCNELILFDMYEVFKTKNKYVVQLYTIVNYILINLGFSPITELSENLENLYVDQYGEDDEQAAFYKNLVQEMNDVGDRMKEMLLQFNIGTRFLIYNPDITGDYPDVCSILDKIQKGIKRTVTDKLRQAVYPEIINELRWLWNFYLQDPTFTFMDYYVADDDDYQPPLGPFLIDYQNSALEYVFEGSESYFETTFFSTEGDKSLDVYLHVEKLIEVHDKLTTENQ